MRIDGKQYRPLKVGAFIRTTDIFANGHKVESYSVGKRMLKKDKRFYQVYREKGSL